MKILSGLFARGSENERVVRASAIAPGVGIGETYHLIRESEAGAPARTIVPARIEKELDRIRRSVQEVKDELERVSDEIEERFDAHTAQIFLAQRTMLEDHSLDEQFELVLKRELVNGEEVVRRVFLELQERFRRTGNKTVAARSDDLADLSRRIELRMSGGTRARRHLPPDTILVAHEFFPSDTALLPASGIEGLVIGRGSPGSHVAVLAKQMGIPVVAGLADPFEKLPAERRAVVDGDHGVVFLDPMIHTLKRYRRRIDRSNQVRLRERWLRNKPVTTRTGRRIEIQANVSSLEEAQHARKYGAQGVGLFRLEALYLGAESLPQEEELSQRVLEAILPLRGKPITIRLLDVGGDKQLPYLHLPEERNPFLGRRGIRLLFHYPELLRSELRALLAVHQRCPIQILVPMVTFAEEMRKVREILLEVSHEVGARRMPKVGAMIETPAAAVCAGELAELSDFLSIGTNDLTQYTMAADRDNELVGEYYKANHRAVLLLIRSVVAQARNKPVCVCGDIAGDLEALPALLAAGVNCISVVPGAIAEVKNCIRGLDDFAIFRG